MFSKFPRLATGSINDEYGKYYCAPPGSSKYGDTAYGNQFQAKNGSKEAMDEAQAKRLGELSAKVLGLSLKLSLH